MLLRSSSTPILGSLLSSSSALFCESPNNGCQFFQQSVERAISSSSSTPHTISCCYPRLSDSFKGDQSIGMRRTQSEGNIQDLLSGCSDDSHHHGSLKPSSIRRHDPVLETIPSFSVYNSTVVYEDEEENMQDEDQIAANFSFTEHGVYNNMDQSACVQARRAAQPLFLARGLGIDRIPSGLMNLGNDGGTIIFGADSGDGNGRDYSVKIELGGEEYEMDLYYKRAIDENPSNAIILKNYAQFLYQCKRDLPRAEEYYSRAILADPVDADTLSQYGKLIWELHGDHERALTYIENAANMNGSNCFVQAAYASFLWETGEEDDAGEDDRAQEFSELPIMAGALASASI